MTLSNKTYDILKWAISIVLPAFATLYLTLGQAIGLPNADAVVATVVALETFLGAILLRTSAKYKGSEQALNDAVDGNMVIQTDPGGTIYSLEPFDDNLEKLADKDVVSFRVR